MLFSLLAIVAVVFPVAAQDETFGLSANDWTLFQSSQVPENFAYDFTTQLGLDISNVDNMGWDFSGSGLVGSSSFSTAINGTLTSSGEDSPIAVQVRAVDGSLYLSPDGVEWWGGTEAEITEMLTSFGSMMGGSLPVNPMDIASGDMSGLMSQPGVMEAIMGLSSIDPATFTTITRLADVNGNAHFQTTLDISALISSPALAPLIGTAAMGSGAQMTAEQSAQLSAAMAGMFSGSTITVDQYIDPATGEIQQITLTIAFAMNAGPDTAAIDLSFDILLSDADGATVEAPATFQSLNEGMNALTGGM